MPDFAPDAFNIWGNFNKDQKKDGHYWAAMEVPVAEPVSYTHLTLPTTPYV